MFKHTKVCAGLMLAFGTMAPMAAMAQQAAAPAQALERVEITGSRIKSFDPEGASPITVIGAEQIKFDAVRSVEGILNNLPMVFADQGGQVSNGASGTATVNLRNLGASRTLVLINGRRLPAGSPRNIATDLNQIPVSMIQRVEVLTSGASAIYGSDAIAGVVNFIMKNNFEGIQFEANHSFYNHSQHNPKDVDTALNGRNYPIPGSIGSDGKITDFALTLGGNFANGKGNAIVVFSYKKEDALLQSERDFSACSLGVAAGGNAFNCAGSGTSFPGRFLLADGRSLTVADANGTTRKWLSASDRYNFGPLNYFQRPSNRYSFNANSRFDISEQAKVYSEFSFHDDHTVAQIAPSGLFGFDASGANSVKFENPLLSADWRTQLGLAGPGSTADLLIFRRNVEGGGRQDDIRHTSYRGVVGVKGDIGPWSYDAFAQLGRVVYQETYKNDFSNARIAKSLDVVADANGNPVCRTFLSGADPNCVPYNIWSLGKITPEALSYLQTPGFQKGFTSQRIVGASVQADLGTYGLKLPTAKNGIGFAAGVEHRTEELDLSTDTAFTTGDLAGQGGPTIGVGGSYTVKEIFGEIKVPLMENQPFAHLLAANASYRHSSYSTNHKTNTYGTGLEWAPVKEAKLRGSYSRAARAANIVELFTARGLGLYDNAAGDPCAGATPTATLAQCARTGVTAAQYGNIQDSPAGQYNAIFGGNPDLKPETSDTYTLGIVASPVKDLTVSLDYWSIKVKDVINNLPSPTALSNCLASGDPQFCSLIHRDRIGTLWATPDAYIIATNLNLATWKTEGIDFGADYNMKLAGFGGLNVAFNGTWLKKFERVDFAGAPSYDCAGYWDASTCGTPAPKWRHKLRFTWNTPWNIDAALTWRYFGKTNNSASNSSPVLAAKVNPINDEFAAQNYIDLAARYSVNKNITIGAAINNLFDKDPPIGVTGAGFGNGNTFPVVYDALGRKISVNLTVTF